MMIAALDHAATDELAGLLVETVAAGGSVSFMHPLAHAEAAAFWRSSLAAAANGERVVIGARDPELVATLTLLLAMPPNQPHRAELAKMMTRVARRGQGIARALVLEAERLAIAHGKRMITLDTAEDAGAAAFYAKLGYERAGVLPDYAYRPHGGLTGTVLMFKRL
jgi:ribosomal protein S18 acetylase RimI-like enzyme